MTTRLVQLKLVGATTAGGEGQASEGVTAKAALVLRVEGENVSIENGALLRASSHQAWSAFQDASRKILEAKDVLIFRLEGSKRPLCSVLTLLGQPSNMVSVVVSQVPRDPLPASTRSASVSPSHPHHQQQGLADLDGVLRRTQEMCRSLTSLRSRGASPAAVNAGVDSRATRSLDSLSPRTLASRLSWAERSSTGACSSSLHALDECDLEVERLLQLSESLTQRDAEGNRPSLPDAPRNVTILKNFRGGMYVIWDPVRLDAGDKNNGHLVTGYSVSLNGQLVTRTTGPVSCQVELNQLEANTDYVVTASTCGDTCDSTPSKPVYFTTRSTLEHQQQQRGCSRATNPLPLYRSQSARPRAKWPRDSSDGDSSSLVAGLTHSRSMCTTLPSCRERMHPSGLLTSASSNQCSTPGGQMRPVSSSRGSTPGGQTRPVSSSQGSTPGGQTRPVSSSRGSTPGGQTRPVSSSRDSTPGGQMKPVSSSRGSTPGGQMRPVSSSRGSTPGGQMRPVSSSRGSTPGGQMRLVSSGRGSTPSGSTQPVREVDSQSNISEASSGVFTDYPSSKSSLSRSRHASTSPSPLALKSHTSLSVDSPCRTKSSAWSELNGAGPMPPSQVRARLDAAALSVSWEPVRHDKEGRSNGFYVLGYRVYASGHPVASVDGAGSDHVLVDLSSVLPTSCVKVDVRTRAISGESEDASTLVYSMGLGLKELCPPPLHSVYLRCETCV